jgi:hypothetical protein
MQKIFHAAGTLFFVTATLYFIMLLWKAWIWWNWLNQLQEAIYKSPSGGPMI